MTTDYNQLKETNSLGGDCLMEAKQLLKFMTEAMPQQEAADSEWEAFYNTTVTFSYKGQVAVFENSAAVYTALQEALEYIIDQQ